MDGGVLLRGPEGEEGVRKFLDEEQVIQVSSCMAHCFLDMGVGLDGDEEVVQSATMLGAYLGVLVVGVGSGRARVSGVETCLVAGLSVGMVSEVLGASVSGE